MEIEAAGKAEGTKGQLAGKKKGVPRSKSGGVVMVPPESKKSILAGPGLPGSAGQNPAAHEGGAAPLSRRELQ
jgi:hypothetical protein